MAIVGFAYDKIECVRNDKSSGNIKINNNVAIKKVEEKDFSLGKSKQLGLRFMFEFKSSYDPDLGHILLTGEVLWLDEEKKVKDILASWKKDKKVPQEVLTTVLNNVLSKCNIEALILSKEINLPPPMPMPSVDSKKK